MGHRHGGRQGRLAGAAAPLALPVPVATSDVRVETSRALSKKRLQKVPRDGNRLRALHLDQDDENGEENDNVSDAIGAVGWQYLTREA